MNDRDELFLSEELLMMVHDWDAKLVGLCPSKADGEPIVLAQWRLTQPPVPRMHDLYYEFTTRITNARFHLVPQSKVTNCASAGSADRIVENATD